MIFNNSHLYKLLQESNTDGIVKLKTETVI